MRLAVSARRLLKFVGGRRVRREIKTESRPPFRAEEAAGLDADDFLDLYGSNFNAAV
jgi:hypothetical protein